MKANYVQNLLVNMHMSHTPKRAYNARQTLNTHIYILQNDRNGNPMSCFVRLFEYELVSPGNAADASGSQNSGDLHIY